MASIGHAVRESTTRSTGLINLLSRILLPLGLFAIALFGAGVNAADAANSNKIASDLRQGLFQGEPFAEAEAIFLAYLEPVAQVA